LVKWAIVVSNFWLYLRVNRTKGSKLRVHIFWTESGRGRPPGNVRVNIPDVPPKYGPRTTSRSEVFDLTVNDFFVGNVGQFTASSCFLVIEKNVTTAAKPIGTMPKFFSRLWTKCPTGSRRFPKNRRYKSSDLGSALPKTENRKWIRHSHLIFFIFVLLYILSVLQSWFSWLHHILYFVAQIFEYLWRTVLNETNEQSKITDMTNLTLDRLEDEQVWTGWRRSGRRWSRAIKRCWRLRRLICGEIRKDDRLVAFNRNYCQAYQRR